MSAGIKHKFMDGSSAATGQKKRWARKRQCQKRRKERLAAQAATEGITVNELKTRLFREATEAIEASRKRRFVMPSPPYRPRRSTWDE